MDDDLLRVIQEERLEWGGFPINIGITGRSGCGKSTFINTVRGLKPTDNNAAEVGVTECTKIPTEYCHPQHPEVSLWDLPGVGTPKFSRERYLREIQFSRFDFFLLMSKSRFTEDDIWLGKEVRKLGKDFIYIRTRIDEDVQNDRADFPSTHNEEELLHTIREDCLQNLQELQPPPDVYLISGTMRNKSKWDFPKVYDQVTIYLPTKKQQNYMFSMHTRQDAAENMDNEKSCAIL